MKVKILKTDTRCGIKEGEIYEAEWYWGGREKVTLVSRVPDGFDPECNEYAHNIEVVKENQQ